MSINFGTATPTDYKLGSSSVSSIYLGTTQVWPVASGAAKITIARNNGASSFSGDGKASSTAFTRATPLYLDDADGLSHYSWTATASATVYVSFYFNDDSDTSQSAKILVGSTSLFSSGMGSGTISKSFSVLSGNVITISATGDPSSMYFSNVSIYAL